MSISAANRAIWERPSIVAEYADPPAGLHAAEASVLERYRNDYVGKQVLDLGIGCGRTTRWLAPHASVYVGLDYSHQMVKSSKELYAEHDIRWGDARNLSDFGDQSFEFVLFSFNGIDCASHEDRSQILHEIGRVLKRDGLFAFSSHNLCYALKRNIFRETICFGFFSSGSLTHPLRAARYFQRASIRLYNRIRNARKQRCGDGYALVNDPAHDFAIVGYYVHPETQTLQLREAGFHGSLEIFDTIGRQVTDGAVASDSPWLHYVVRK